MLIEEFSPPFLVGAYTFSVDQGQIQYDRTLREALKFIDSCLCRQDVNGNRISDWTQAKRLVAIGIELPPTHIAYAYLHHTPEDAEVQSYWGEEAKQYSHLWRLRDRVMEEE